MLRGIISGLFWGAIVAALGLASISLVNGPPGPDGETPNSIDVAVPAGSEFNRNRPEAPPVIPGTEENSEAGDAPLVTEGDTENAPITDTASAAVPSSGSDAPSSMSAPDTSTSGAILGTGDGSDENDLSDRTPGIAALSTTEETVPATPEQPAAQVEPDATGAESEPEQPAPAEDAPLTPAVQLPAVSETAPETESSTGLTAATETANAETGTDVVAEVNEPVVTNIGSEAENSDAGTEKAPTTAVVRRLPSITTEEETGEQAAVEGDESAEGSVEVVAPALDALSRNARPFVDEGNKPLMSIVLIDVGSEGLDRSGLTTFSFPVTMAINPVLGDSLSAARAYRAAGLEVLVQAPPLPEGMGPQQIGQHIGGLVAFVPQAIGLVDAVQGGFQSNGRLIGNVVDALSETGHGLLTYDRGLNTAMKAAAKEGLAAGIVFRTLDAENEDAETIKRYLDRAAFKAGQDGQVIMIGHSYPETVKALYSWILEPRSQDVTLAPLSAVLRN